MTYLKESVVFETGTIGDKKLKTAIIVQTILFINLKINMTKKYLLFRIKYACEPSKFDSRATLGTHAIGTAFLAEITRIFLLKFDMHFSYPEFKLHFSHTPSSLI